MRYAEMAAEILAEQYPEWSVLNGAVLICPHGHRVEYDGKCFEGCTSPFILMGIA